MTSEQTNSHRKESLPAAWATMANEVREFDQDNVQRGKGAVDTLLVFAGLFSAVLASFLVAVYPNLQPSPLDTMNYTLERIANQTASYNFTNGQLIATNPIAPPPLFRASAEDIRVNVLWFASLVISLITSSLGMLVKQWMDDFLAMDMLEPQARLRLRHFREPQIQAWKVYEIVACLPLLLHLSLGLFFVGLCYFTSAIHTSVGRTTFPLVIGWTICLFSSIALPIFFPRCPYKISLLQLLIVRLHRTIFHLAGQRCLVQDGETSTNGTICRVSSAIVQKMGEIPDEGKVIRDPAADLEIFAEVDAVRANDEILSTIVAEELPLIQPNLKDAVTFALEVLAHRAPTVPKPERPTAASKWPFRDPFPFDLVSSQAKTSILSLLYQQIERNSSPLRPLHRGVSFLQGEQEPLVLYTLTMIMLAITDSYDVNFSSNVIEVLRWYLGDDRGPSTCRGVLYLMGWDRQKRESRAHLKNVARLLMALRKLATPLKLDWKDLISSFKYLQCLTATYPHAPVIQTSEAGSDVDNVVSWQEWEIPSRAYITLWHPVLEYLFTALSAEFRRVEKLTGIGSSQLESLDEEPREVLRFVLRQLISGSNESRVTGSGLQAFVDLWSTKNEALMGVIIEVLVDRDIKAAELRASGPHLRSGWSHDISRALHDKRITPSNPTTEEDFRTLLRVVNKKLSQSGTDHVRFLSLWHITIFLFVAMHAPMGEPGWAKDMFSALIDKPKVLTLDASSDNTARQLTYDCLHNMRHEHIRDILYSNWHKAHLQVGSRTSFPEDLITLLGRFIPEHSDGELFHLRELRGRLGYEGSIA